MTDLVGKVKRGTRKPCITQEIVSKMNERGKRKNVDTEEGKKNYKRLRNGLKRATTKAKKEYVESVCEDIIGFQRRGSCDLRYIRTKKISCKQNNKIQNIGVEDSQGK
jgi:hypothetical protein